VLYYISKYVDVVYKVKHYVNNQALHVLHYDLINSLALYGLIAWGIIAPSCHSQPISVILDRAMRCLNKNGLVTRKVTPIHKTQEVLQLKVYTIVKWKIHV